MRVLLDTNVLVRATGRFSSPARELFQRLLEPQHIIVASAYLLEELRRVMSYPRVQRIHGLTDNEINTYIADLGSAVETVDVPSAFPFSVQHDPDDDPIVAASVFGRADVLCTLDKHLRRDAVVKYCAQYNVRVLTDIELLSELHAEGTFSS